MSEKNIKMEPIEQTVAQTITYDDFEKSLIHDGIEMIVPEEDDATPQRGIGAVGYSPRKTAPSYTNPYYLKEGMGGYNRCILITGNSVLPNCVGYAHGRALEIGGIAGDSKLPICNAEDWFAVAKANGLKTGSTPKVGATIVWRSGNFWNSHDGCGHVGTVEEYNPATGKILVSQSNYGGTRFFLTEHKPPYNIFGQQFVGFIYNPYYEAPKKEEPKKPVKKADQILTVGSKVTSWGFYVQALRKQNGQWQMYNSWVGGWIPCAHVHEVDKNDGKKDNILHVGSGVAFDGTLTVSKIDVKNDMAFLKELGYWVYSRCLNEVQDGK